nr:helix-turn-helix transcriptional regulator [Paenibacillus periandrae]
MSLSKASGVAYTTIRSMIERDLANASIDNVLKICRTLGIDAESLGKTDSEREISSRGNSLDPYALSSKDERDIMKRLEKIKEDLASDMALAYNGEPLEDEEDREALLASIENTLRLSKYMAKKKFTPNKYRK